MPILLVMSIEIFGLLCDNFAAFRSGTKCSLFWSFSGYGKRIFVNLVNRTYDKPIYDLLISRSSTLYSIENGG